MTSYEVKTADEVLDYGIDWTIPLGGDAIETSAWEASPATIGLDAMAPSFTPDSSRVWLAGGESGTAYTITNTVTTRGGRTFQQVFYCDVY